MIGNNSKINNIPILIIIYKRYDLLKKLINQLRLIKPSFIYIAADGPRKNICQDIQDCDKTRAVVAKEIDWTCKLYTNYSNKNLGCRERVSSAISWFFETVDFGIIMEEDCIPSEYFFQFVNYCRNRVNENIYVVSGNHFGNYCRNKIIINKYPWIWGWATWKSKWNDYDNKMLNYENEVDKILLNMTSNVREYYYWKNNFDLVYNESVDSWYYVWLYNIWKNNGRSVTPPSNLVINIGFDGRASHTSNESDNLSGMRIEEMDSIDKYEIGPCKKYDEYIFRNNYQERGGVGISKFEKIKYYVKKNKKNIL